MWHVSLLPLQVPVRLEQGSPAHIPVAWHAWSLRSARPWGLSVDPLPSLEPAAISELAASTIASPVDVLLIFLPRAWRCLHPLPVGAISCTPSFHRCFIDMHYFTPGPVLGIRVSTENKVNVVPPLAELRVQQGRDTEQGFTQTLSVYKIDSYFL